MWQIVLRFAFFVAMATLLTTTNLNAQQGKDAPLSQDVPAAPVPAQILNAKKVFIANGGMAVRPVRFTEFHGGPDRPYNQFYCAITKWGRYELVTKPSDADLVLEISFTSEGSTGDFASLHLAIVDPKTHILLWAINERVEFAARIGHRDDNFDRGITALMGDLKSLDARPKTEAARGRQQTISPQSAN